jgi:hypothetical protein
VDRDRVTGGIRIILLKPEPVPDWNPGHADPDPADPDWYQVQTNEKLYFFQENRSILNIVPKLLKIMTH